MADDFVSGMLAGQEYSQKQQLFQLSQAEGAVKVETQRFALENAKLMQQRQEKALSLMSLGMGHPSSDPTEVTSNILYSMGNAEIEAGLLDQGADHIKQASTIQEQHSQIVLHQTEDKIKRFTFFGDLLKDVQPGDEAGWSRAKMIYQSQFAGQLDPKIANQPFTAELKSALEAGTQTALQKAQTEAATARKAAADAETSLNKIKPTYYEALTREADARAANLERAGGSPFTAKSTDVNAVTDLITAKYPDVSKDVARTLARPVAEEAVKISKQTGIPLSQAYKKAFNAAAAEHRFLGLKPERVRPGESAKNPLPIPMKDGKPDLASMEDNKFYSDPRYPGVPFAFDKERGGLVRMAEGDESEEVPEEEEPAE
jgi:hypothetical protein